MTGVTLEQLDSLAARAPLRAASFHPNRAHAGTAAGDVTTRARAYLAQIPGAVSGDRGHDRTFRAACKLVLGFALTPDAAYPLLAEWNQSCVPPWPESELWRKLHEADKRPGPRGTIIAKDPPPPGRAKATPGAGASLRNYTWDEVPDGESMRKVRRGRRGPEMVEELLDYTGGWPRRCGQMLFAKDKAGGILWMKSVSELFAWIDWQYAIDGGRGYEWVGGPDCLTQEAFLASCRQHCEDWAQVELFPHDPPIPGHFYHHPEIPADTDGSALADLVARFRPHTPEDEELIRLFFITLVWGGPPRKRPVFLFEAAAAATGGGRGAGKTTVAVIGSALVGGFISVSPREQLRDIHARVLSPEALTRRVVLIDNLKALRFSDSDIEGLITTPVISGKQMYTGEGRRPNTLTWVVTSNKPSLSKDLAQRSIIIRVSTPTYTPEWERDLLGYIEAHRWKIIADCVRELRQPARLPEGFVYSRWAEWEQDVMSKATDPTALASELASRRDQVDDDDEIAAEVSDAIREMVKARGFREDHDCVLIPSQVLFDDIVKKFAGQAMSRVSGLRWLYNLGIARLCKYDANAPYRGALWYPLERTGEEKPMNWADRFGPTGIPE